LRAWGNYGGRAFREANTPDHPTYLLDPLDGQSPEWLETVATYARELAAWKRQQRQRELDERRAAEEVDDTDREALDARGVATDPAAHDDVPANAYIKVKATKQTDDKSYRYYYWQWRNGDSWENEYIAPVDTQE
jgi:hypothetical protein